MRDEIGTDKNAGGAWVSVSEVATARGISERAIQKQCKAGKLRAQLVTTESGTQWQIAADGIARTPEPNERTGEPVRARTDEPNEPTFERAQTQSDELANQRGEPNERVRARTGEPNERTGEPDMMAHLIEENRFLRNAIEQHQRSEAELRNALRTALAAMPKALNEGRTQVPTVPVLAADGNGPKLGQVGTENARELGQVGTDLRADEATPQVPTVPVLAGTSQNAPEREFEAQTGAAGKVTGQSQSGRNSGTVARDGRGFRGWLLKVLRG